MQAKYKIQIQNKTQLEFSKIIRCPNVFLPTCSKQLENMILNDLIQNSIKYMKLKKNKSKEKCAKPSYQKLKKNY